VGWSKRKRTARLPQLWLLPSTYSECTFRVAFVPMCWPEEHSVMYKPWAQNGMVMIQLCSTLWCYCFTVITEQYSETCTHSSLFIFFTQVVLICFGPYKSDTIKTYLQLWFSCLYHFFLPQFLKKWWIQVSLYPTTYMIFIKYASLYWHQNITKWLSW